MTSKSGDVVWANGYAWQRDDDFGLGNKRWWIAPSNDESQMTLKELKTYYDDFVWLVKNGKLVWNYAKGFADGIDTADSVAAHAEGYNEGYKEGYADAQNDTIHTQTGVPSKISIGDVWTWPSTYVVNWDTK